MRNSLERDATPSPRAPETGIDSAAAHYRAIGISAVAAALRFTTQPEPVTRRHETAFPNSASRRDPMAA